VNLEDVIQVFRKHLYLPDPASVEIVLGVIAANLLPGDPVWLLLVGPPASGKTEILSALSSLSYIHAVSTMTQAGLLSGSTARREFSTGGLLAEVGKFGIIVCKDFTSILSEAPDSRLALLAALREIYDGQWVRRIGSEGGRNLGWTGKVGLLAAVTETIDRYSTAMGAMGERFVLYRMPAHDNEERLEQGRAAMRNAGVQPEMRAELAEAVCDFFAGFQVPSEQEPLDDEAGEALVLLADLATRCRSGIERDSRSREVELVPQTEALGRLQAVLAQFVRGLWAIGVSDDEVQRLVRGLALDGMPKARRAVLEVLAPAAPGYLPTAAALADELGLPTGLVDRALTDLAAHGVVQRHSGRPHPWGPTEWLRERWRLLDP